VSLFADFIKILTIAGITSLIGLEITSWATEPEGSCLNQSLGLLTTDSLAGEFENYPKIPLQNVVLQGLVKHFIHTNADFRFRKKKGWSVDPELSARREREFRKCVSVIMADFKADPVLQSFSDLELTKAAVRAVTRWKLIFREIAMDEPSPDIIGGYEFERYRLYLRSAGVDPDARPPSFARLLERFDRRRLAHGTTVEGLIASIKDGSLKPRGQSNAEAVYSGGSPDYLYLESLPRQIEGPVFLKPDIKSWPKKHPVFLDISPEVLDEVTWSHFNVYWKYGEKNPEFSVAPSNMLAAFFNFTRDIPTPPGYRYGAGLENVSQYYARSEFNFTGPIDIRRYVRGIHVNPEKRQELLDAMKAAGINQEIIDLVR
jgi:hypothetical protein